MCLTILFIGQGGDSVPVPMKPGDPGVFDDGAAEIFDLLGGNLPQLAGAELGILELFDEGGVDLAVFDTEDLAENVPEDAGNGKALGALSAPGGINLARVAAPEILGVILKEQGIELAPEGVDIEILEVVLRQLVKKGPQIAEAALHRVLQAHIAEGLGLQGDRIIVELAVKEDPGNPVPGQHDHILLRRIRPARGEGNLAVQEEIVPGRCTLEGHHGFPPGVHLGRL